MHEEIVFLDQPRYRPWEVWESALRSVPSCWTRTELGRSEEGRPLWAFTLGSGPITRLAWAQMHGNEPTATEALLEIMHTVQHLPTGNCWAFFPLVNPDGAHRFTRVNANGLDLNRDARSQTSREARILWNWIQTAQPIMAYNLHDQRSWFGIPGTPHPATFSVLAARANPEGIPTDAVVRARGDAGALARRFAQHSQIPCTTFDDSFYPDAFGENVQSSGISVVLVETGSHPKGYSRRHQAHWLAQGLMEHWLNDSSDETHYLNLAQAETGRFDAVVLRGATDRQERKTLFALTAVESLGGTCSVLDWEVSALGSDLWGRAPFWVEVSDEVPHPVSVGDRMALPGPLRPFLESTF